MTQKDEIKEALREVMQEELKQFYVDRETHYLHHKFLKDWMEWLDASTNKKITVEDREAEVLSINFQGAYLDFRFTGEGEYQGACKLPLNIAGIESAALALAVENNIQSEG